MTPEYLRSLYPSIQPGQYVALGYADPLEKAVIYSEFFEVADPDWPNKLLERTKVLGSEQRSTFVYRGLTSGHSRKDDDVVECHYVAVDYDIKDGYPRDLSTLWAALDELNLPKPTYLQRTSDKGYTALWRLTVPERQGDRFNANLIRALKGTNAWQGYKLDSTGNMARAVRLLGSTNYKAEYGPDFPVVEPVEETSTVLDPDRIPAPTLPDRPPTKATGAPFEEGDFRSILAGCQAMRQLAEHPAEQSEPLWLSAAGLAATCRDGEKAFHDFSKGYPGYDPTETATKFAHAAAFVNGDGGPPRCDTISDNGGRCEGCPFAGKLTSPAQLGRVDTDLVRIASEHVHIPGGIHRISDIAESGGDAPLITRQDFDMIEGAKVGSAWAGLRSLPFARKGQTLVYLPGAGRFPDGATTNLWSPTPLVPVEGDFPNVRAVLSNLLGEGTYRDYFERLLAYHVRNTSVQTGVVVFLTTVQGAGKDSLLNVLALVLGRQNVRRIGADALDARWTAEMVDTQVLAINELQGLRAPEAAAGRIKDLSGANDTFKAEAKGKPLRDGLAPRLIICSSNMAVPISIDESDRRTFAPPRVTKKLDGEIGKFLNTPSPALSAEAAAFLDYLLNKIDLGDFDRHIIPDSDVRQAMIRAGKPSLYLTLKEGLDRKDPPFDKELVKAGDLRFYLVSAGERVPPPPLLGETMRGLGWESFGQKTLPNGERPSLWVRTTAREKWADASPGAMQDHLDGPLPPMAFTPRLTTNNPQSERV